jgi:hypothetical protein
MYMCHVYTLWMEHFDSYYEPWLNIEPYRWFSLYLRLLANALWKMSRE